MICCENCFKDEEIKSIISRLGHVGNCDICHSENIPIYDARESDTLVPLVLMTTLAGISRQTNVVVDRFTINSGQPSRTVRMPISGLPRFLVESRGLNDAYWSPDAQWVLAEGNGNGPIRIFSYDAATQRWRPLTTPAQPQQIVLVGAKTGYFTSASGVWKTVNGGKSWVALPSL